MPRPHSFLFAMLAGLCLLAGCGGPPATPAVFSAQQAPIARALTPTPALASESQIIVAQGAPVPQSPPATPAPIAAQAVPVAAPPAPLLAPASPLGQTIDGYMNDIVNAGWFQGAILVARGGQVIISKGYGMADAEHGTPNTAQTRFRLASVTKQFTAAAVVILQARGQLNVQDSICTYLPNCPNAWREITVLHLLTHTSGLPNYTDFASYEPSQMQPTTPDELIARFRDLPLVYTPGTTYSYENSDYVLLGRIVEQVSGQAYADFLRDAIFAPLQMNDSGVDAGLGIGPGYAVGYGGFNEKAPALDASTLFSAGAAYSTVEDLYRWDQALYSDAIVPAALRAQMFTPFLSDYAFGWKVDRLGDRLRLSHPGLIDGFATYFARYPDDHVTVIVLGNMDAANTSGIGDYLASLVFGSY
ncbi:MAG TPA: serine hydrolase domain-containing protein [Roseiflexaceae bacterium]|nr:serine hydrolase domain-containing protein [Roseiflexaceae bacterium]